MHGATATFAIPIKKKNKTRRFFAGHSKMCPADCQSNRWETPCFPPQRKEKTMQPIPCKYFKNKLTKEYMAQLKADTDLQVSDTEVPGYHLRYSTKTGRKVLYLHYILRLDGARRERNLRLGNFPELSATNARAEAIKYRGQIITGIDPMLERQESLRK